MSDEGEAYSDEYVEAKRREYLASLDEFDEDCLPAHKLKINNLTAEFLRDVLSYDKNTGEFVWRNPPKMGRVKKGEVAGALNRNGTKWQYLYIQINRNKYPCSHLAWLYETGNHPKNFIDHINGDSTDNRICNLRDVSPIVNAQNQRSAKQTNKLGLLGVCLHKKSNKYQAQITVNKKRIQIGLFNTAEEAHAEYIKAKRKLHLGCSI